MKLSNRQRNSSKKIELSMTSMIDVVFLLLIFFIVQTTFIAPERQLRSNVKTEEKNPQSAASDLEPAIVEVVEVNGQPLFRLGALETSSTDELIRTLKLFDNKLEGAFVRGSDNVPAEWPVRAINACKQAGFLTVTYLPISEGEIP